MIMIPILHVLGHGGIIENTDKMSVKYELVWFLEIACYCAVNTYALISGYVGYRKRTKYSNLLYLCFQILFYTVVTTVVIKITEPSRVGIKDLLKAFLPVPFSTYWYFSAYFCLFFVTSIINYIVENVPKRIIEHFMLALFFTFSLLPTITFSDYGKTMGGCSFLWLAILYLVGAYLKKYEVNLKHNNFRKFVLYFICVVITWISKFIIEYLTIRILGESHFSGLLISYTSPTIIMCSIFLLLFFANIKTGKLLTTFAKFFAPLSFGVYLFHEEPLIREYFIKDAFISYLKLNPVLMLLAIIGTALFIWLFGSLVDRVRLILFDWLHVKQLSEWIEKKLRKAFCKIEKKVDAKYSIID